MIAQNDSSVMVRKLPIDGTYSIARTASGVFIARSINSTGVNIQKVTKAPAARKATSLTLLSFCAIMLLPRQFHVSVVENSSPAEVSRARWLFPLYLVVINLFVIPIAIAGL